MLRGFAEPMAFDELASTCIHGQPMVNHAHERLRWVLQRQSDEAGVGIDLDRLEHPSRTGFASKLKPYGGTWGEVMLLLKQHLRTINREVDGLHFRSMCLHPTHTTARAPHDLAGHLNGCAMKESTFTSHPAIIGTNRG